MPRTGGKGAAALGAAVALVLAVTATLLLRPRPDDPSAAERERVLGPADAVAFESGRRIASLRVDVEGYGSYPAAITDDGRLVMRRALNDQSEPTRWWLLDPATGRRTPLALPDPDSAGVVVAGRHRLVFVTGATGRRTLRSWDRRTHRWTAYAVPAGAGRGEPVLAADGRAYVVTSRGEGRSAVVRSFRPGHPGVRREESGATASVRGDVLAWTERSGTRSTVVHLRRVGSSRPARTVRLPGCDVSATWGGSAAVVARATCGHAAELVVLGPDGSRRARLRLGDDTEVRAVTDRYLLTTADALDLRDLTLHRLYRTRYEGYVAGSSTGTVIGVGPGRGGSGDTTVRFVRTR